MLIKAGTLATNQAGQAAYYYGSGRQGENDAGDELEKVELVEDPVERLFSRQRTLP